MTKNEIIEKLTAAKVAFDPKSIKKELEKLLPANLGAQADVPAPPREPCKSCSFDARGVKVREIFHERTIDGPGIGHWYFDPGQKDGPLSKAAIMFRGLASQPKKALFVPLTPGEQLGYLAHCQLNGLRIAILKGVSLEVPQQIADVMTESMNITSQLPYLARTAPNPYTQERKPANLDLRDEETRKALNLQ